MDNMQIFKYSDSTPLKLRVLVVEGAPWLVLSDLSKILRVSNATQLARTLPDEERRYAWLCGTNSRLEYIVVSEKGLHVILKRYASKLGVGRIINWIRRDVLPHIIRKGGFPASFLHKEREMPKTRRKPSTPQPATVVSDNTVVRNGEKFGIPVTKINTQSATAVPVTPMIRNEEKSVIPVTKTVESKSIAEYELFDLWEVEMFLRFAEMENQSEAARIWCIERALRELRKKKPLDGSDPRILELQEVVGSFSQRVKHLVKKRGDWIFLNPVMHVAKCVGCSPSAVNAYAEYADWKRNGVDGFWVQLITPNGAAREFMYTDETRDLLIARATEIQNIAA